MSRPFSVRVSEPAWFDEVSAWIRDAVGADRVRSIEHTRIRPWSTQVEVETDQGKVWFKQNCQAQQFEPGLQEWFGDQLPHQFDQPMAVDRDRGWMLTRDRGQTWIEQSDMGAAQWQLLVQRAAQIQQSVIGHAADVVDLGVPDCSPETVLTRFDRLIGLYSEQPVGHPAHVPAELRAHLTAARPSIERAVETLTESRLPSTWNHGDLHPANVFVVGEDLRLFDLGDSQWAHALEILSVPYGWITERSDLQWAPILEAYADQWDLPASLLLRDWDAVRYTHAVNRSLTWWYCLTEATADEWNDWGDTMLHHLSRVLDQ